MTLYDLKKGCETDRIEHPLSVALGCFDGLHLGHAELISAARGEGHRVGVFTFVSNPFGGLHIITLEEKLRLLGEMGVDYCAVCEFDEIRELMPESFVQKILIDKLNAVTAVCGFNFRFGKGASGDSGFLRSYMSSQGRRCIVVDPFNIDGSTVSSSRIRLLLADGNMEEAARLLGRSYSLVYNVTHGNGIGNILGFPTINQKYNDTMQPIAMGVYICSCMGHPAVTNFGVRPTITEDTAPVYETFILDYNGDLYEQSVRVEFLKMLRPEMKFSSPEKLIDQIKRDVEETRRYFK